MRWRGAEGNCRLGPAEDAACAEPEASHAPAAAPAQCPKKRLRVTPATKASVAKRAEAGTGKANSKTLVVGLRVKCGAARPDII